MTAREEKLFKALVGESTEASDFAHVQTEWIAISGAPGSGKTTTCDSLAAGGVEVIVEASRNAIHDAQRAGFSPDEVHQHPTLLAQAVLLRKLDLVRSTMAARRCVWDSALVDAVVFARRAGLDTSVAMRAARNVRFRAAAILSPLPHGRIAHDPVRPQTEQERQSIDSALRDAYAEFGYAPFVLEVSPAAERVRTINRWIATLEH